MTTILAHDLALHAPRLLERLRVVLSGDESPESRGLRDRAVIDHRSKPRMGLVGQFSSGKSTLIKALTDEAVDPKIDADIATDEVTEYPWDGAVILVDTPGVQSGIRQHDELAWDAIGKSDLILFVITVNLFDDASAAFFRDLAHGQQMFDQMIVVITQTSKLAGDADVRRAAVREALGTVDAVPPICEVDSLYYLRSLHDEGRGQRLRGASGIDRLRIAINRLSEDSGELATLRQPIHLVRQLCDEAQSLFAADPHRRKALSVLAAQRKAVTDRRGYIDTQFRGAESRFKSACLVAVSGFVDCATTTDQLADPQAVPRAWASLQEHLNRHASAFADEINHLAEQGFDTLAAQLGDIDGSNRVGELLRFVDNVAAALVDHEQPVRQVGSTSAADARQVDWTGQLKHWLSKGRSMWGAGGGVKASAGSFGHATVKRVGHLFGAKFKPWQAVRIADKIGKVAGAAGWVLTVGQTAHDIWREEAAARVALRAEERRRAAFVTELMSITDGIADDARHQLDSIVNPEFEELLAQIDTLKDAIIASEDSRSAASTEIRAIADDADRLLRATGVPVAVGATVLGDATADAR